ncbi:hypothetical protein [Intestinibacter bartlettii]|uniref:hypothetical protein n=1 Tax=Intestinibacter bartlettii TaxID=261299 RepID=UPI0008209140|nr:hypothetical protein [Intestinibacter bartlettii]SCI51311.1 Uncharacterised protein [uncultured Clostridium sp.]
MDKKLEVAFMRGATPIKFEVEVKYTAEGPRQYFNVCNDEVLYGLLYCDKVTNGKYECLIKKTFDYENRKIILEIGN